MQPGVDGRDDVALGEYIGTDGGALGIPRGRDGGRVLPRAVQGAVPQHILIHQSIHALDRVHDGVVLSAAAVGNLQTRVHRHPAGHYQGCHGVVHAGPRTVRHHQVARAHRAEGGRRRGPRGGRSPGITGGRGGYRHQVLSNSEHGCQTVPPDTPEPRDGIPPLGRIEPGGTALHRGPPAHTAVVGAGSDVCVVALAGVGVGGVMVRVQHGVDPSQGGQGVVHAAGIEQGQHARQQGSGGRGPEQTHQLLGYEHLVVHRQQSQVRVAAAPGVEPTRGRGGGGGTGVEVLGDHGRLPVGSGVVGAETPAAGDDPSLGRLTGYLAPTARVIRTHRASHRCDIGGGGGEGWEVADAGPLVAPTPGRVLRTGVRVTQTTERHPVIPYKYHIYTIIM